MRFLTSFLLCTISTVKYATSANTDIDHPNALITWIRSKGGIFNSKLDIIQYDNQNESSYQLGMSALKNIPSNEILFKIPSTCLIESGLPSIGDKVLVSSPNAVNLGTKAREGEITLVNKDISFDIKFDDGEEDQYEVQLKRIKKLQGDSSFECGPIRALAEEIKLGSESSYVPYVNYLMESKYSSNVPRNWSEGGKTLFSKVLSDRIPPHDLKPWWQMDCGVMC